MAPRSMRRGFGVRAILAGGLLAILAGVVPAGAITAPVFVNSSFETGWNPSAVAVAARFDKTLKAQSNCETGTPAAIIPGCAWTTAKVFKFTTGELVAAADPDPEAGIDNNGAVISGGSIVWVAKSSLAVDGTEYYMEVSYLGAAQSSPTDPGLWRSEPFTVDAKAPGQPRIESPTALATHELRIGGDAATPELVHGYVSVADPTQAPVVEFSGTATDATGVDGDLTATSGLAAVELQFFDVAGRPAHKQRFPVETVGAASSDWFVGADEVVDEDGAAALDPGIYTLKVVAFDIAGGVSAPSLPVQFIFAGATA